ncbi:MAG: hypothetical protein U9Q19_01645 [Pseudomonadota bacterium]|nr:hypothetical protein [Pseudomonadota bacterium]
MPRTAPFEVHHRRYDEWFVRHVEDALTIVRECRRTHIRLFTIENVGHESVEKIKTHEDELVQFLRDIGFPLYSRVAT